MKITKTQIINIVDQVSEAFHSMGSFLSGAWTVTEAIIDGTQKLGLGLLVAALYLGILSLPILAAVVIFRIAFHS